MLVIPSSKHITRKKDLESIADPEDFYIPLQAYGSDLSAIVAVGERVKKYQVIANSVGTFGGSVHSPVSGTVIAFFKLNGKPMIHLKNDFSSVEEALNPPDLATITRESLPRILRGSGIQGGGGALFPTHLKYSIGESNIETLIFNGVECEPYLTADFTLIKHHADNLIKAAKLLSTVLAATRVVFAIERQNLQLKKILLCCADNENLNIQVKVVDDGYPQGGELQLIRSVTGVKLPKGSIPAHSGILVNNVGTLWAIYNALFKGLPSIDRIVTISGNSCTHRGNYLIKIGTPILHALRQTGNLWSPDKHMIILGGAMMGKEVSSPMAPVHKGSGGILIMRRNDPSVNNCIKCGLCVDVCPQGLMPLELVRYGLEENFQQLRNFHLQDCIECGACAYVCPSDVPLMESIFQGKAKLSQLSKTTQ